MNKKGFTLVELLAVIAILAILVIIALPNVLEMYRNARQNTFTREVASVYDAAHTKYFLDAFGGTTAEKIYSNITKTSTVCTNCIPLDIQGGNDAFQYCIVLTTTGEVKKLDVVNGAYKYTWPATGNATIKDVKEIKGDNVSPSSDVMNDCTTSGASYN